MSRTSTPRTRGWQPRACGFSPRRAPSPMAASPCSSTSRATNGTSSVQPRGTDPSMTRYVIGPDVAVRLAQDETVIRGDHQILAPALLRSQLLSLLYQAVRRGEMTRTDARLRLR